MDRVDRLGFRSTPRPHALQIAEIMCASGWIANSPEKTSYISHVTHPGCLNLFSKGQDFAILRSRGLLLAIDRDLDNEEQQGLKKYVVDIRWSLVLTAQSIG
jgi:hypothetical protein